MQSTTAEELRRLLTRGATPPVCPPSPSLPWARRTSRAARRASRSRHLSRPTNHGASHPPRRHGCRARSTGPAAPRDRAAARRTCGASFFSFLFQIVGPSRSFLSFLLFEVVALQVQVQNEHVGELPALHQPHSKRVRARASQTLPARHLACASPSGRQFSRTQFTTSAEKRRERRGEGKRARPVLSHDLLRRPVDRAREQLDDRLSPRDDTGARLVQPEQLAAALAADLDGTASEPVELERHDNRSEDARAKLKD